MHWPISSALVAALREFGIAQASWELFANGLMVMGEFASYGGEPVTVILDGQPSVVSCGIFRIHNLSGQALRDFLRFRKLAFALARSTNVRRLKLAGYEIVNNDVERFLRRQGFADAAREIPPELQDSLGPGCFNMLVKEFVVD